MAVIANENDIGDVQCDRNCKNKQECLVTHPINRKNGDSKQGTFFPKLDVKFDDKFYIYCHNFVQNGG